MAYLLYVALAQSLLLLAVLPAAVAPRASAAGLQQVCAWLTRHFRPISVTVGLVFGGSFLWKGATGLLA